MEAETPQKQKPAGGNDSPSCGGKHFLTHYDGHKPGYHPRTPNSGSASSASILSFMSASILTPPAKRFHSQTQTNQKQQRVRNPFEAALAERLHLPMIASPSLFQRPTTPQLSSTQFEWNIEEVSSLKPVHVEAHETQFQDSPDADYEAKAQSAISSFFKEHQIVPSPVNCPLRQQRIILAEINGNTPIAKPGRRIRDYGTQTTLSLPSKLPADLEEALRPYFQPHLSVSSVENSYASYSKYNASGMSFNSYGSADSHNVSMRRKLFDIHNIIVLDENRKLQTPTTPQLSTQLQAPFTAIAGKLSDSLDKSSSSLMSSPIVSVSGEYLSPSLTHSITENKEAITDFEYESKLPRRSFLFRSPNAAELSPIYLSPQSARIQKSNKIKSQVSSQDTNVANSRDFETPAKFSSRAALARRRLCTLITDDEDDVVNSVNENAKFTPDRSSSPLHSFYSCGTNGGGSGLATEYATTFTTDSFHRRISRLVVTSAKTENLRISKIPELVDVGRTLDEDDSLQVSQLNSNLSSSSINSHCDTPTGPTGKRRSASRKNLSQSFTANWDTSSSEEEEAVIKQKQLTKQRTGNCLINKMEKIPLTIVLNEECVQDEKKFLTNELKIKRQSNEQSTQQQVGNFHRTDSGFNEMTTSCSSTALQQDESSRETCSTLKPMCNLKETCCSSTPSKQKEVLFSTAQTEFKDL